MRESEGESADDIVGRAEWSTLAHDAEPRASATSCSSTRATTRAGRRTIEAMIGKHRMRDLRFYMMHEAKELSLVTRSNVGLVLFLANMVAKMNEKSALGSRIADVHNSSSQFAGDKGQGIDQRPTLTDRDRLAESNLKAGILPASKPQVIIGLLVNGAQVSVPRSYGENVRAAVHRLRRCEGAMVRAKAVASIEGKTWYVQEFNTGAAKRLDGQPERQG